MSVEPEHLDGNALGGILMETFGREMTAARGCCAGCGAIRAVAGVRVYTRAPGIVARCPDCDAILIVVLELESRVRVSVPGLRWFEI